MSVILGEGSSEEVVLPKVVKALYTHADSAGISIAPLGGRHVNHFWRLLSDLRIPYITLLDLDCGRYGGGWERVKYAASKLEEFKPDDTYDWPEGTTTGLPEFQNLGKRDDGDSRLNDWIGYLETKGVFFSSPLDLDFAMLCAFPDVYKAILRSDEAAEYDDKDESVEEEKYKEVVQDALEYVLHSGKYGSGSEGVAYTENQKNLMPSYKKLFLGNRGKPSTHLLALADVDDEAFKEQMPEVLKRLAHTAYGFISEPLLEVENEE